MPIIYGPLQCSYEYSVKTVLWHLQNLLHHQTQLFSAAGCQGLWGDQRDSSLPPGAQAPGLSSILWAEVELGLLGTSLVGRSNTCQDKLKTLPLRLLFHIVELNKDWWVNRLMCIGELSLCLLYKNHLGRKNTRMDCLLQRILTGGMDAKPGLPM